MTPHASAAPADRAPIEAREWLLLLLLTVAAGALRAWHLGDAGIVQYDEGVYAFTGLGIVDPSQPHRFFPQQEKFSPPFYFSMVALSYLLRGVSDTSAIVVNVVLGTLTIPVVWAVARRWFGPAAAAAAAVLLTFNPTHLTLSRAALTDVSFTFNFVLALAALAWALERGGTTRAIVAGLATGLAWNTKYHGWFAGVIAIGAVAAIHWRDRRNDETKARARLLAIAAGVAIVCYIPWTLYIRSQPGSVEGWSRYFATMLRIDWVGNLVRHVQQQDFLETPWSRASVPLALLGAAWARRGTIDSRLPRVAALVAGSAVAALLLGAFATAVVATIAAVPVLVRRGRLTDWMLLAWLALWFVMAPIYHPYFRLLLPFCVAIAMGTGAWLDERLAGPVTADGRRWAALAAAVAAAAVFVVAPRVQRDMGAPWRRGNALRVVADSLTTIIPSGQRVTVLGEPALAFYLHRAGRPAFESPTVNGLETMAPDGYVVAGVYAKRARDLAKALDKRRPELDSIATLHFEPEDLRLLDDARPLVARAYRLAPDSTFDITVFRFRSGGAASAR